MNRPVGSRFLCAAAVLALSASPVGGMLADIPLEIIAARSDLIMVGEVTQAGEPTAMELTLPDADKPVQGHFCIYQVKVARAIKDVEAVFVGRAGLPAPLPADVTRPPSAVSSPATTSAPVSQPARVVSIIARSRPPAGPGPVLVSSDDYSPNLQVGASYVLLLQNFTNAGKEKGMFYLPSYPKNYQPLAQATAVAKAADVDNWPWGRAQDGLKLALVPHPTTIQLVAGPPSAVPSTPGGAPATTAPAEGKPEPRPVYVQCVVALRNTYKLPLGVALFGPDKYLTITATDAEGKVVTAPLYKPGAEAALQWTPGCVVTVPAGGCIFLGPTGLADYGLGLNLPLYPGKWKLQAGYASARDATGPTGQKAWTGRLESAPAEIEVAAPK